MLTKSVPCLYSPCLAHEVLASPKSAVMMPGKENMGNNFTSKKGTTASGPSGLQNSLAPGCQDYLPLWATSPQRENMCGFL